MDEVVSLAGVRKSYGLGTPVEAEVLHGIDLSLRLGELVALIGPSGSGKSTLLNLIGLLERPTSGTIRIAGEDTGTLAEAELTALRGRAIGFVFQFHHLLPGFNALENVLMPSIIAQGVADAAATEHARDLLAKVGLAQAGHKRPGELSGGMQQRVAVARALSMKPRLVLADEPTGNLDTKSAAAIFDLFEDFNRETGAACLIVTHDPRLAARCHRCVEIVDGRLTGGEPV